MPPSTPLVKGDSLWWAFWRAELAKHGGIEAQVKYHIMRIASVDEVEQEFEAHVRVDVRIQLQELGKLIKPVRNSYNGGKPYQVVPKSDMDNGVERDVEEFDPQLQFLNLKRSSFKASRWSRIKGQYVEYSLEVNGFFGIHVHVVAIPLDIQQLSVTATSEWDSSMLRFVPWQGDEKSQFDTHMCFELTRTFTISNKVGLRVQNSLKSPHGYTYTEATGTVVIKRHYWATLFLQIIRPLILSLLAFAVFYMPPDPTQTSAVVLNNRLNISLIVLLAFAVEPRRAGDQIRYVEYYVLSLFAILCGIAAESIFVFGLSSSIADQINGDRTGFGVMAATWLVANGVFFSYVGGRILWVEKMFRKWKQTDSMVDVYNAEQESAWPRLMAA